MRLPELTIPEVSHDRLDILKKKFTQVAAAATLESFLPLRQNDGHRGQHDVPILRKTLQRLRDASHEGSDGNCQVHEGFGQMRL
jgi:hypothetical protein